MDCIIILLRYIFKKGGIKKWMTSFFFEEYRKYFRDEKKEQALKEVLDTLPEKQRFAVAFLVLSLMEKPEKTKCEEE